MTSRLKTESFDIIIVGFKNGSVVAYFAFLLQGQQFIDAKNFAADLNLVVRMLDSQAEIKVQEIVTDKFDNHTTVHGKWLLTTLCFCHIVLDVIMY